MKHAHLLLTVLAFNVLSAFGQVNQSILDSIAVPYLEARQLVANYGSKARQITLPDGSTVSDTRALWFSVDVLKALVTQLEAHDGDGVRCYLAAYRDHYPDSLAMRIPAQEHWGRNTLLLVPTIQRMDTLGNPYHDDVFVWHQLIHRAGPERNSGGKAYNDAGMCPPACDGARLLDEPNALP